MSLLGVQRNVNWWGLLNKTVQLSLIFYGCMVDKFSGYFTYYILNSGSDNNNDIEASRYIFI